MSRARQALGRYGEDLACRELRRLGYAILERRYRRRDGEVDIIARDGETTVFVEVKARDGHEFGEATDAVTRRKRGRMKRIAIDYLMRNDLLDTRCRFDVVSIHFDEERPAIEVYQNAFDA